MPTKVSILDNVTGLTTVLYSVDGRERVKNDPGRYSIVDDSDEVAAKTARGTKIQSSRLVTKAGAVAIAANRNDS